MKHGLTANEIEELDAGDPPAQMAQTYNCLTTWATWCCGTPSTFLC